MPGEGDGYAALQDQSLNTIEEEDHQLSLPQRLWPNPVYHINLVLFIALFLSVSTNFVLGLLKWPIDDLETQHNHRSEYGR